MKKANDQLGVSFELPDRLTVDQLDDYQKRIGNYLSEYQGGFLSTMRYRTMMYSAAVEAGLITEWHSDTMPDVKPNNVGEADALVILFVGETVEEYLAPYTTISPKLP